MDRPAAPSDSEVADPRESAGTDPVCDLSDWHLVAGELGVRWILALKKLALP